MQAISIGELEKQVMDILWEQKKCSARDILSLLKHEKKLAYTTVATILQRLYDKGLLKRTIDKTVHIYSPKISKEKYSKSIAQNFLKNFIDSYGDTAIASFAESVDKLPKQKRKYFLELLDGNDTSK